MLRVTFTGSGWPHPMDMADNLRDLERHAKDFAERHSFSYTVLAMPPAM